jgi:hypothetical protein
MSFSRPAGSSIKPPQWPWTFDAFYATYGELADGSRSLIGWLVMTDLVAVASAALGLALSEPVSLAGSGRSVVLRCKSPASGTIVLKSYPATSEGAASFAAESAGLEFIAGLNAGPELIARDSLHRLIAMTDLGVSPSLADLLLASSPKDARDALVRWARACGELAAGTAGRRAEFTDRPPTSALGPGAEREETHWLERRIFEIPGLLEAMSVEAPEPLDADLHEVASVLRPGKYDVFSPGDICPDNNLITAAGVKFIDFENAEFHSAFLDAAYLRMPFSTCWCAFRIPAEVAEEAEQEYRSTVCRVIGELAGDEIWHAGVRRAMAAWTLHAMTYLLDSSAAADTSVNPEASAAPTRRQLLTYRWQRLSEELDRAGEFPALSALMRELLARTRSWRAAALPFYPAFR